jgi:hypothetical protein
MGCASAKLSLKEELKNKVEFNKRLCKGNIYNIYEFGHVLGAGGFA